MSKEFVEKHQDALTELLELYNQYEPAKKQFDGAYGAMGRRIDELKKQLKMSAADTDTQVIEYAGATIKFEPTTQTIIDPKKLLNFLKSKAIDIGNFWSYVKVVNKQVIDDFGENVLIDQGILTKERKPAERVRIIT